MLAEMEQRRWHAERSLTGWTHDEHDDKIARSTHYLIDWNDPRLPESIKDYDRDSVKYIPTVFGLIERKVVGRE
jgi:hypothetical protein